MTAETLWALGERSIRELEVETGIMASGRAEIYGCIFGRDSLITALKLLHVHQNSKDDYYPMLVRKVLLNLAKLQGTEHNIESGEEPGKIIHEYRTEKFEHLSSGERPWHIYPDNVMRNYDTVDATPLFLMAVHQYWRETKDEETLATLTPHVRAALEWLLEHADTNGDGLIDYWFHPERKGGGLVTQSWMDSHDSVFFENSDDKPEYPIAPVEAQAYAFVALRYWSEYFAEGEPEFSKKLLYRALHLKKVFNEKYVLRAGGSTSLAYAIDGAGKPLSTPRSSMGHCLWAVYKDAEGVPESVLDLQYVSGVRRRLMGRDLFVRRAGVRTLSQRSRKFDPVSYHNGTIWPHDTAIIAEGFRNFGFVEDAKLLHGALLRAYEFFETPIELFAFTKRKYARYDGACQVQAWSAAALLVALSHKQHSGTLQ